MKHHSHRGHRHLVFLFALLSVLMSWQLSAIAETSVRASVDRNQLSIDETFTLSLLADSILFSGEPDVSTLEDDFHIINRQQSSRTNIVNGKINSSRQWDYTLAAKREGTLTIPAIAMGKYRTRALTVTVGETAQQSASTSGEAVYMESDVSPRSAYVQQELQYTVKVFTSVNFLDASLDSPEVDNAVVESGGEQRYQTLVDGRYYQVIERRYSIYPQTSGDLVIPALTLQARVEGYRPSMLDPGRLVVKRSSEHRLRISPPDQKFKGRMWLPARNIKLVENWSKKPDNIHVGDSITRSISIQADGLLGSQLPSLPAYTLANAKLYPDQAKLEKADEQSKWTGSRTESVAIIPTQSGDFELPEISIPWWNTKTNKAEMAILPARKFKVMPSLTTNPQQPIINSPNAPTTGNQSGQSSANNIGIENSSLAPVASWLYAIIIALLISNLSFALAWWRSRGQPTVAAQKIITPSDSDSQARSFAKLKKLVAAKAEPALIRQALKNWASLYFDRNISLSEIGERIPTLHTLCSQLDAHLYSGQELSIDTAELMAALKKLRNNKPNNSKQQTPGLNPLYPQ
jgi:hypothetical protein